MYRRNNRVKSQLRKPKKQFRNFGNNHRTILDYTPNKDNLTIYNDLGRFMPDREFVKLRFVDPQRTRGNGSAQVTNWAYKSDVTDIDSGLNTPVGFTELSLMYRRFRVHSMTIHFQLSNPLTTAVVVVLWPSNVFNTHAANAATLTNIQESSCLPGSTSCITGTVNASSVVTCTCLASAKKLMTMSYFRDEDSASDATSSPTTLFYLNVGIYNTAGANFGQLLPIRVMIDLEVEAFEREYQI